PPISRIDLIVCRNTLMYFNADAQRRVLNNFHFALKPGGFLFVGKSEALASRTGLFTADNVRLHVFTKPGTDGLRRPVHTNGPAPMPVTAETRKQHFVEASFESSPVAQMVIGR